MAMLSAGLELGLWTGSCT